MRLTLLFSPCCLGQRLECWPIKKFYVQKMYIMEIRLLRWMLGHTRSDKIRIDLGEGGSGLYCGQDEGSKMRWFGYVQRRCIDAFMRYERLVVEGMWKGRGRP